jgi:hypothetical protein
MSDHGCVKGAVRQGAGTPPDPVAPPSGGTTVSASETSALSTSTPRAQPLEAPALPQRIPGITLWRTRNGAYGETLRPVQYALGEHNAGAVGLDAYQCATQAWFAVGRLIS